MNTDSSVAIVGAVVMVVLFVVVTGVMYVVNHYNCKLQWERSGLKSEYGLFQGCMVELADGRWLPAKVLRDIDIRVDGGSKK